jgi:hypothetical protein
MQVETKLRRGAPLLYRLSRFSSYRTGLYTFSHLFVPNVFNDGQPAETYLQVKTRLSRRPSG